MSNELDERGRAQRETDFLPNPIQSTSDPLAAKPPSDETTEVLLAILSTIDDIDVTGEATDSQKLILRALRLRYGGDYVDRQILKIPAGELRKDKQAEKELAEQETKDFMTAFEKGEQKVEDPLMHMSLKSNLEEANAQAIVDEMYTPRTL